MFKEPADGFCMALADSVPGVSGGTVAFIMGFYDRFIGSINDVVFGSRNEKISGLKYLCKLGTGWVVGMCLAVIALNALFEQNIHTVSSLFVGFILGALPVVCSEESKAMKDWRKGILFLILGAALVTSITLVNTSVATGSMDLATFSPALAVKLFFIGMTAISAMFLPGISGSTMLLIFGAYMPIMNSLKDLMQMNFASLPAIVVFILGLLAGAASVVKLIKTGLEKYRPQMIYFILGMMGASLYAVVMGPVTLKVPQAPLSMGNFSGLACVVGIALVMGMQWVKVRDQKAIEKKAAERKTI